LAKIPGSANFYTTMKRTFVIGDIHGGLRALQQVLERAAVQKEDTLIFLGDYVDGWSESAQTLSFIMDRATYQSCIFIKGNHDEWCESWLKSGKLDKTWLISGGKETIKSYAAIDSATKLKHLNFLEGLKFFEIDTQHRLFIHAGFTSMHGPEQEFYASNYRWDRTLWEMAITMDTAITKDSVFYPQRLKLYSEIYIGHTPTLRYHIGVPMQGCNVWNVDTGAAFTGKLTIMDIDTKEFWQSDPLPFLYPGELGRNNN
jgi:serine/threonine protein phosphatase 1